MTSPCSDHVALVVKGEPKNTHEAPKARRYEVLWERDGSLPDVIKQAWEAVGSVARLDQLQAALSKTMGTLNAWSNK